MSIISYIKRLCKHTAVYWEPTGSDGYGNNTYANAKQIKCRWVNETELIQDNQGKEIVSNANILTLIDLKEDGMLYQGTLNDLDSSQQDDPKTVQDAHAIVRFTKVPDVSGKNYKRKAFL